MAALEQTFVTENAEIGPTRSINSQPRILSLNITNKSPQLLGWIIRLLCFFWDYTESNFTTFVIPNSSFGLLSALASSVLSEGSRPSTKNLLWRAPLVVLFNWFNVLNFDLANQRSPKSIQEDRLNKPRRPIVAGKVTVDQTRRAMLATIPAAWLFNYALGVWKQGASIQILTWMYNDLEGGDEIIRDLIISIAYGMFNSASLEIALGSGQAGQISRRGIIWTAIISMVILTTMQVQDLKDQAGDRTRGRKTIVVFFGERASRTSIALFVSFWSLVCPIFWSTGPLGYLIVGTPGAWVAWRVTRKQGPAEDCKTWKSWCLWTVALYFMPIAYLLGF
ncbi:UbiA prenyltransferase family-domain-containing protein [Hypoxylon trugodes]|uniref:UbiA prenyltransferase family-domain-containing protein n=1 Tax=Hypoxylon trugodes TaxID=326681 RepID=UPI002190DD04|nr:UbiA prenyltransferase family-domain-containing protein [Hypoxylon trugodes]KAI1387313.1 UbiA prenyltransferase family-domain-containing protein [Hypoxylon trugodes]